MSKVLNISEAASIAIHSMALIAQSKELLNAHEIAEITGFSKNHISKVLQQLVKNNLLNSTRGPKGGFEIKRKPEAISLMEIYKIIDGEIDLGTGCKMQCENCPFNNCIFGGLSEKFSREFSEYLRGKTLAMV